ncbi:MAG TPA: hypothetical protein ENK86_06375 [Campylobacterales bacterium]|nr:hypothetical protein [Campylobacterales bacterium]
MPKERVEEIKEAIHQSDRLSDDEKSTSVQHIEEWVAEDEAFGIVYNKLVEINSVFEEIFKEMGLV